MNLKSDIEKMVYNLNETRNYIAQHCLDILKSSNKLDDVYLLREADTEDINNIESKVRNFLRPFIQEKSVMPESSVSKVNLSIHDILRFLEKNLMDEIWHVYPSTSMGCSVIKSKKSGLIYYMDGWDTSNPIGPSKVYGKLKRIVKGKKIDKWIFLANKFSSKAKIDIGKSGDFLENVFLVELPISENLLGISVYGKDCDKDPLINDIIKIVEKHKGIEDVYHKVKEEKAINKELVLDMNNKIYDQQLYIDIINGIRELFNIKYCEHVKVPEIRDNPLVTYSYTLRERISSLEDIKKVIDSLFNNIRDLYHDNYTTIAIKSPLKEDSHGLEIVILCPSCKERFLDKLVLTPIHRLAIFEYFINRLGEVLGYKTEFIRSSEIGVLYSDKGDAVLLIYTGSSSHVDIPWENIERYKPKLIIAIKDFISDIALVSESREYFFGSLGYLRLKRPIEIDEILINFLQSYGVSTLVYDWETGESHFIEVSSEKTSLDKIIENIVSVDFRVDPSVKAYRAPHDEMMKKYLEMGFNLGFKSVPEYPHGSQRIDVAWLDKDNNPIVCIEIEFSGSINNDLWKICEVNPELGVLVVRDKYLKTALKSVLNSRIIKLINQKLLIMDAFQHSYVLIEGNRIIKTGSPLND